MKYIDMKQNNIYMFAETAFSHEGDLAYLYKQIDAAVQANADAIKFQIMLDPFESYTQQVINQSDCFKWIYTEDQWKEIVLYARKMNLEVNLLPVDMEAMDFCLNNQDLFDFIEIHSINLNHKFLLEKMNDLDNKFIILGIGGRSIDDITYALKSLDLESKNNKVIMMYGFQSFPTDPYSLKLGMIRKISELFGVSVGFADHTSFDCDDITILQLAYAMGARVFEKHIVLEKGIERTDYQAAIDFKHFIEIREQLEYASKVLSFPKDCSLNYHEQKYRAREKKIVAKREIRVGDTFNFDNLGYKVANDNSKYEQRDIEKLLGQVSDTDYSVDQVIH